MDAIRTWSLTKFYGPVRGVEGLDLTVGVGEAFGFLGPNGAGKTTTLRLLLDLIRPTSGRAEVLGFDTRRDSLAVRRRVGYLPGQLALDGELTGREQLAFFAGLRSGAGEERGLELAERLDLDLSRPVHTLSKGNRQKVGLVQAFMADPDVLLLDEPTSGLDPLVQHQFQQLVEEAVAAGRTVLLSSHVLSEVQRLAQRVAILREGTVVAVEHVDDLRARALRTIEIVFTSPVPQAAFEGLSGIRDLHVYANVVRASVAGGIDPLIKAAAHYEVEAITTGEADLEDVFLSYYRQGSDAA